MDTILVHQITNPIPATDNRLDRTRIATTADPTLNQLRHYIFHGWPLQKCQLPQPIQHYWNYCEELAIEDGLIFKAHRLVIPTSQRAEYLKDLHEGHLGEEKTLLRARETVFWPGISDDIRNAVKACDICQKHNNRRSPSRLMTYLACHGSSSESTYLNTVPTTTYWLQIISANFLL